MKLRVAIAALFLTGASVAHASPPNARAIEEVDRIFADWRLSAHVPGLVYGIVADGRLVHVKGLGAQELEGGAGRGQAAVRDQGRDRGVGGRIAGSTQRVEEGVIGPLAGGGVARARQVVRDCNADSLRRRERRPRETVGATQCGAITHISGNLATTACGSSSNAIRPATISRASASSSTPRETLSGPVASAVNR